MVYFKPFLGGNVAFKCITDWRTGQCEIFETGFFLFEITCLMNTVHVKKMYIATVSSKVIIMYNISPMCKLSALVHNLQV